LPNFTSTAYGMGITHKLLWCPVLLTPVGGMKMVFQESDDGQGDNEQGYVKAKTTTKAAARSGFRLSSRADDKATGQIIAGPQCYAVPMAGDAASRWIAAVFDRLYAEGRINTYLPAPNLQTLAVLAPFAYQAGRIVDFGCGHGRYLLPLLELAPNAEIVGVDVSVEALERVWQRLQGHPGRRRVTLLQGDERALAYVGQCDLAMALYGPMARMPGQARRLAAWRRLRVALGRASTGHLVLTVPGALRRPWRALTAALASQRFVDLPMGRGDSVEHHPYNAQDLSLYQHLYRVGELVEELSAAGFTHVKLRAETVLPENWVVGARMWRFLDRALRPLTPPALGHMMMAIAQTRSEPSTFSTQKLPQDTLYGFKPIDN
jgi:tRNA (uracil-5-)-methyltransferase TRM9